MGNHITVIIQKVLIVGYALYTLYRFKRAQRHDATLKMKVKGVALVEVVIVSIINIAFLAYPVTSQNSNNLLLVGLLLICIDYVHLNRYVAIGKRVIYIKEMPFEIRRIDRNTYEKGVLTLFISGKSLKVRYPITDIDHVRMGLSGKRPKNRKG